MKKKRHRLKFKYQLSIGTKFCSRMEPNLFLKNFFVQHTLSRIVVKNRSNICGTCSREYLLLEEAFCARISSNCDAQRSCLSFIFGQKHSNKERRKKRLPSAANWSQHTPTRVHSHGANPMPGIVNSQQSQSCATPTFSTHFIPFVPSQIWTLVSATLHSRQ